jgi:type IV secretory pathway VirB10-like protein
MDLKSSNKKFYLLLFVGVIIVVLIIWFILFLLKDDNVTNDDNANNSLNVKTFLTNKIDPEFLSFFNNEEQEEPQLEQVEETKVQIEPKKQQKIATPKSHFDDLFHSNKARNNKIINNNDAIAKFLNAANNSTEVKTFVKFNKNQNNPVVKKDKKIDNGYKQLNISKTNASLPIDFSRVLTADRRIDALIIEDIDSSLGGKVTAQIENNIYAAHGRNILIPIGSKAIGRYQQLGKVGDTRLGIIWQRIITPKGVNIVTNAEMTDAMGRVGITGDVDTKFWDKYGTAILFSTISALSQTAINADKNQVVFINTFGKEIANVTAKILDERIDIRPVVRIPAGTRIAISLNQDIWFRDIDGNIEIKPLTFNTGEIK